MNIWALILIVILLVAVFPAWPYSAGWGYRPLGGLLGVILLLVFLRLLGII